MEWIKIERNEDGSVIEECLNRLCAHCPPILLRYDLHYRINYELIANEDIADWRRDIDSDVNYTHYLPLPKVE